MEIRDQIVEKLTRSFPHIQEVSVKNIEIAIYNYIIDYCTNEGIQIDWNNYLFKHLYVSKFFEIVQFLQSDPRRADYIIKNKRSKDVCDLSDANFTLDSPQEALKIETEIEEGLFKCPKCKSKRTTYYSVQLRSSDEPMTNFITCVNCKNRWKN